MANNTLICPNCKKSIQLSEALLHEFQEEFELKHKKDMQEAVRLAEEKAKIELEKKNAEEIEKLKKQNEEKDEALKKRELESIEEKRKLEEERKEFELNKQKEEEKIREAAYKEAMDNSRLEKLEYEKKINDMQKALEEAQRKGKQGSQQLQGEVLELDFEEALREAFPTDDIIPVEKGKIGADVRQIVKTARGTVCGVILWETKRTKGWSNDWPEKLKKDLRAEKANVPIIVTNSFPKGFNGQMGMFEGVWLVDYSLSQVLAELMRQKLIDVAREKYLANNKEGKKEQLYEYIISHEFVQQVESILEVHREMVEQVNREKAAFEKQWKTRLEYSEKLVRGTARMVGSIQGRLGESNHLQIKGLDMLELDSGEEN